jgi:hypothetical protein
VAPRHGNRAERRGTVLHAQCPPLLTKRLLPASCASGRFSAAIGRHNSEEPPPDCRRAALPGLLAELGNHNGKLRNRHARSRRRFGFSLPLA